MRLVRHALAVLVLPFTVVVIVPTWIGRASGTAVSLPDSPLSWALAILSVPALAVGALLFATTLRRFGVEGEGTLAPWDPPRKLVVRGPYAYVRNPMISGVILLLLGESLLLRSAPHLEWALMFALFNAVYIPLLEEARLRARFGDDYRAYARQVPRLIPRSTPWRGEP
jgi:protein-S-isoprenylcysteine O-methyltransferase Ste14